MARDVAHTFEKRLAALGRTNDALSPGGAVDLTSLLNQELISASHAPSKFALNGPCVAVSQNCAFALGLLFHELSCNAARHGSLSSPGGRVDVNWGVQKEVLDLTWVESGGPEVQRPSFHGMGNFLIKYAAAKLEGSANVLYLPSGLRCELRVSLYARWPERRAGILLAERASDMAPVSCNEAGLGT